jgi:hypothetical protein
MIKWVSTDDCDDFSSAAKFFIVQGDDPYGFLPAGFILPNNP